MPASIFTNNDKPISRREDEGKVRPGKRMDEIFVAQEPTFVDFSCRTDFHWGL